MSGFFEKLNASSARKPSETDGRPRTYSNTDAANARLTGGVDVNFFNLKPVDQEAVRDTWNDEREEEFGRFSLDEFRRENRNPALEVPLIDRVMSANAFVNSGADASRQPAAGSGAVIGATDHTARPRRPKYMPVQKSGTELFDEETQIHMGPAFAKISDKRNDCDIAVTGGDGRCPIIDRFEDCEFSEEIYGNLRLRKYGVPTQIQKCVMPLIMFKSHDIMGHAQTGSGKTAAFLLPIVDRIQSAKRNESDKLNRLFPHAILVVPTKELAEQLGTDARSFSEKTDVRVAISYGDMPVQESINQVRYGCDIFVSTCGRLVHFVQQEIIKLDRLMFFVLDEADKLLNDTFLDHVRAIKQHKSINLDHRTLMFSATFGEDIQELARTFLHDNYYSVRIGEINRTADTVTQTFVRVSKYNKQDYLVRMLMEAAREMRREDNSTYFEVEKTIVFVQHKRMSDRLAVALAQTGFLVISINADRSLKQRLEAKEKFTRNVYNILVATDVAARGLNFPDVTHVVNYDLPEQDLQSYVHRIGRAGRAGNLGRSTAFFDVEGEEARQIGYYVRVLQEANQEVPQFMVDMYHAQLENEQALMRIYGTGGAAAEQWN